MIKYSTISLPKELYDKLLQLIEEKPELGYGSVADFCKEAIRLHVEEIKRELREDFLRKLDVPLLLKTGCAKDITVKNYVIEKEKRTRQLYEYIIDEICESIIVVQDGKIKFLNKSISSTGYELEEIIGKNFLEFVADEDKERIMENYRKMMEGKLESKPRRYKFKLRDGRIKEMELYSKKIEFEGRPAILTVLRV